MENEKLKKTAHVLSVLTKIVYRIALVFAILFAVFAVVIPFFGDSLTSGADMSIELGPIKVELAPSSMPDRSTMYGLASGELCIAAITLVYAALITRQIHGILAPISEGTPFGGSVSAGLKRLAFTILFGGIVTEAAKFVVMTVMASVFDIGLLFSESAVTDVSVRIDLDTTFIVTFLVVYMLSLVFRCGEELQRESDETL